MADWRALFQALFSPGALGPALVLAVVTLSARAAYLGLRRREKKQERLTRQRLLQRQLVEDLEDAPSPERAFHNYVQLLAQFGGDEALLAELHRAFDRAWMPSLRRQLGRYLRARQFRQAGEFLDEMQWEWQAAGGPQDFVAARRLVEHLGQPEPDPTPQALAGVLEGFRCVGLGATEAVLDWLARARPGAPDLEQILFRQGGAGGRYLLQRWAQDDPQVCRYLRTWQAGSAPALRRNGGPCALWPSRRGESRVLALGVERLGLDLNPFGPEKAEQDPCLPDLFYRPSPLWEEILAPQPGIVVVPPGCGRSALLWMLRYEAGLAASALERAFVVYLPLHAAGPRLDLAPALHAALAAAWHCVLCRDPYALLGLDEREQQTVSGFLLWAAGGLEPLLGRLRAAGLPSRDRDVDLMQELFAATAAAGANSGAQSLLPARPGPGRTGPYDLRAVADLLRAAFDAKSLRRFCQERLAFRPVLDDFSDSSLNGMASVLVEYCVRHLLLADLLDEIHRENPAQYARYWPRLGAAGLDRAEMPFAVSPQALPQGWLTRPFGRDQTLLLVDACLEDRQQTAFLLDSLFERWLPALLPHHVVPKVFLSSAPDPCPVTPLHVRWTDEELQRLLRHRLERAGLLLARFQPAMAGWIEGLADPDSALVRAAHGCPAELIRRGNRLVRRLARTPGLARDEFLELLALEAS